jgi:DNA mismatch endonuclease (patch repair protein)
MSQAEQSFDPLSPEQRSERMSRIRSKDSKPELLIRRLVWSLGYRYRLHSKKLPGRPDMVFPGRKKIIFIHGCFWHQHENCRQYRMPRSKLDFWLPKLESNRLRDARVREELISAGWKVLIVWECQLKEIGELTSNIRSFMESI